MALVEFVKSAVAVDPPNILANATTNVDVAGVAGVKAGDFVDAQPPDTLENGLVLQGATVPVDGTIRLRISNVTAGAIDGASRNWNFMITRLGFAGGEGIAWAG